MNFYEKLLNALDISDEKYHQLTKKVSLDDLENPNNFKNIDYAVSRIKKAMENKEKIIVYGDYDCDGICSTSILVKTFKKLSYPIGYYIPSRYKDGYGLNMEMIKSIAEKNYKLIITVDNGVSQYDAVEYANKLGIDVIVTDHHELPEKLPPCYCIVHPFLKENNVIPQCGAYVSLMISILLLDKIDPYLVSLAGLATISDMMPLISYNRILVKNAIQIINQNKYPQFGILLNYAVVDENILSYSLAPKINAIGRIKEDISVNKVVKYFTSSNLNELIEIANLINSINDERKKLCTDAFDKLLVDEENNNYVNVYLFPELKEGLIGLVAAKLLNQYNKPAIIFTKSENHLLKGSARSLEGFSLVESFRQLSDLLECFGGHALAGGLTIKEENFQKFKEKINQLASKVVIKPKLYRTIKMDQDDFTFENYQIIKNLSPFGEGFEEPLLAFDYLLHDVTFIGNNHQHMKGIINSHCSFVNFNYDKNQLSNAISLFGKLEVDLYRGNDHLVFKVSQIKKKGE